MNLSQEFFLNLEDLVWTTGTVFYRLFFFDRKINICFISVKWKLHYTCY